MNYSIKILGAEKLTVQDTGERLLSVQFNIECESDGETSVLSTQRHGFAYDSTPEQVQAELSAVLAAFVKDTTTQEDSAVFAAQDAQADETIQEVVGLKITG